LAFFESLLFISREPRRSMRVGDLARALRVTVGGTSKLVDRIAWRCAASWTASSPPPSSSR
jgi:DNA-binding MarR family transcriptional regulator